MMTELVLLQTRQFSMQNEQKHKPGYEDDGKTPKPNNSVPSSISSILPGLSRAFLFFVIPQSTNPNQRVAAKVYCQRPNNFRYSSQYRHDILPSSLLRVFDHRRHDSWCKNRDAYAIPNESAPPM